MNPTNNVPEPIQGDEIMNPQVEDLTPSQVQASNFLSDDEFMAQYDQVVNQGVQNPQQITQEDVLGNADGSLNESDKLQTFDDQEKQANQENPTDPVLPEQPLDNQAPVDPTQPAKINASDLQEYKDLETKYEETNTKLSSLNEEIDNHKIRKINTDEYIGVLKNESSRVTQYANDVVNTSYTGLGNILNMIDTRDPKQQAIGNAITNLANTIRTQNQTASMTVGNNQERDFKFGIMQEFGFTKEEAQTVSNNLKTSNIDLVINDASKALIEKQLKDIRKNRSGNFYTKDDLDKLWKERENSTRQEMSGQQNQMPKQPESPSVGAGPISQSSIKTMAANLDFGLD